MGISIISHRIALSPQRPIRTSGLNLHDTDVRGDGTVDIRPPDDAQRLQQIELRTASDAAVVERSVAPDAFVQMKASLVVPHPG